MASRHSAFYSPLLGAISGGFLKDEGFEPTYAVVQPGQSVPAMIAAGEVHVSQSAVSGAWGALEKGQQPLTVHFAQINVRDGFLIAGRRADPKFTWEKLLEGGFMLVHGGQPQAMLAYAMHRKGVDLSKGKPINAGNTGSMMKAFRAGQGDYFHEQGPYPQQLEHEGIASVVGSVGEVIGPVAFSSLTASRDWLTTPEAKRFTRAYRKARRWVNEAPPAEVAKSEKSFFPHIDQGVLAKTIEYYQKLGCWSGDIAVPRQPYEVALDVFLHSKLITRRHPYEQVVVPPPEG
jgi:NitT/TauT family transport system substrate-binding protein